MKTTFEKYALPNLVIVAKDAAYSIDLLCEKQIGYAWEFDRMSDAHDLKRKVSTGIVKVVFSPNENTMVNKEDFDREKEYKMPHDIAFQFRKFLKIRQPQYWFALDIASSLSKGSDGFLGLINTVEDK